MTASGQQPGPQGSEACRSDAHAPSSSGMDGPSSSCSSSQDGQTTNEPVMRSAASERRAEEQAGPKKPRACMGALYFNQQRYDAQKPPLCAGFRKSLSETDATGHLPTDSVPGGDFKYICVGYSAYDEEVLKRAAARRSSQADAVVLPYCEGLEIISAAALSRKPELMTAGGPDMNQSAAPPSSSPEQEAGSARQRPGRRFVPGAPDIPEGMTLEQFRERFEQMAGRIVGKMRSNATFMASHIKRTWQQVARELGGGGGGGSGDRGRDY